jgi:hypothetical protein
VTRREDDDAWGARAFRIAVDARAREPFFACFPEERGAAGRVTIASSLRSGVTPIDSFRFAPWLEIIASLVGLLHALTELRR